MISVERRVHPMYHRWELSRDTGQLAGYHRQTPIIGKHQYFYSKDKIRISLIELPNYFLDGIDYWEICGGGLTDDVERFDTKQEAEARIEELLKDNIGVVVHDG